MSEENNKVVSFYNWTERYKTIRDEFKKGILQPDYSLDKFRAKKNPTKLELEGRQRAFGDYQDILHFNRSALYKKIVVENFSDKCVFFVGCMRIKRAQNYIIDLYLLRLQSLAGFSGDKLRLHNRQECDAIRMALIKLAKSGWRRAQKFIEHCYRYGLYSFPRCGRISNDMCEEWGIKLPTFYKDDVYQYESDRISSMKII